MFHLFFQTYIVSVFIWMLHIFHIYVAIAKVDRDVACVAMIVHICCKCDYLDVVYVSHICCKCFILMLHMFAFVFQVFLHVFQVHISNVLAVLYVYCKCFIWMFQK
jgi:hypothetical protein